MIEPPEVPHHHAHHEGAPKRGLARWLDMIMPVSVLLLSVGSLYVALHTGTAMDKLVAHNEKLVKAQSTPILQYATSNYDPATKTPRLTFKVENVGTGPARLMWVRVHDPKASHAHFGPWLTSLAAPEAREALRTADVITGNLDNTVLPPRDERMALDWERPGDDQPVLRALWREANGARSQLTVEACYCSVFDECWQGKLGEELPRSVPACPAPGALGKAASG